MAVAAVPVCGGVRTISLMFGAHTACVGWLVGADRSGCPAIVDAGGIPPLAAAMVHDNEEIGSCAAEALSYILCSSSRGASGSVAVAVGVWLCGCVAVWLCGCGCGCGWLRLSRG